MSSNARNAWFYYNAFRTLGRRIRSWWSSGKSNAGTMRRFKKSRYRKYAKSNQGWFSFKLTASAKIVVDSTGTYKWDGTAASVDKTIATVINSLATQKTKLDAFSAWRVYGVGITFSTRATGNNQLPLQFVVTNNKAIVDSASPTFHDKCKLFIPYNSNYLHTYWRIPKLAGSNTGGGAYCTTGSTDVDKLSIAHIILGQSGGTASASIVIDALINIYVRGKNYAV